LTTKIYFSTNQLGHVTDEQLRSMLNRFDLGRLVSAQKMSKGVGNQTLFVDTDSGRYVLKGNPLYAEQLIEEKFYVEHLLEHTSLPVPSPYLVDESVDIFGWRYAIMPRLEGVHMNDPIYQAELSEADRREIASLSAGILNEMHSWKVEQYGELDPMTGTILPFEGSYKKWLYNRIEFWLEDAKQYSVISPSDLKWVKKVLSDSEEAFDRLRTPVFVMGDFKADNILFQYDRARLEWRVSGIFDFTTGYFGDGAADLPKMVMMYLELGEQGAARHFIASYLQGSAADESFFAERFRVHMLHQCILNWGCAQATGQVTWDPELSFSEWANTYVSSADFVKV